MTGKTEALALIKDLPKSSPSRTWYWLCVPIIIAVIFRCTGVEWDAGFMLHPDERFLVQVMDSMVKPESIGQYLDPARSGYNPVNTGHSLFVYGTLPIVLTKSVGLLFGLDSPRQLLYLGRYFSAFVDTLAVCMVLLIGIRLAPFLRVGRFFPLIAALLYSLSVLPVQLAHFFAVDSFMGSFVAIAYVCSLPGGNRHIGLKAIGAGIFVSLAMACKIQALFALPLVIGFLLYGIVYDGKAAVYSNKATFSSRSHQIVRILAVILVFLLSTYACLRIAAPYYFNSASFLDPRINEKWLSSIRTLLHFSGPDNWYPPAIQWIPTKPVLFALINMAEFGLGPAHFLFASLGIGLWLHRERRPLPLMIVIWGILFFLYQSIQFVKALRYFLLLYPWMAIWGAYGVAWFLEKSLLLSQRFTGKPARSRWLSLSSIILLCLMLLAWPLMFLNIYLQPHSRVIASQWIYANLPDRSKILYEYWDDPLPLRLDRNSSKHFSYEKLKVFDQDNEEKMATIHKAMEAADYYILSSNRAWASIPKVPWRYPSMAHFYDDLFNGRLGYTKVAEFVSYPSLKWLGLPVSVNDQGADESFTVYDHPKVIVMRRN